MCLATTENIGLYYLLIDFEPHVTASLIFAECHNNCKTQGVSRVIRLFRIVPS